MYVDFRWFWKLADANGEKQTCGRRMTQLGPWDRKEGLDCWRSFEWHPLRKLVDKINNLLSWRKRDGKFQQTRFGGTTWKWKWRPRTCSFCGGTHPDDVIRLMKEGWQPEGTSKGYKRYLHPPGHLDWMSKLYSLPGTVGNREAFAQKPQNVWSPVPPVKVYIQHFSDEQIKEFNRILRGES